MFKRFDRVLDLAERYMLMSERTTDLKARSMDLEERYCAMAEKQLADGSSHSDRLLATLGTLGKRTQ